MPFSTIEKISSAPVRVLSKAILPLFGSYEASPSNEVFFVSWSRPRPLWLIVNSSESPSRLLSKAIGPSPACPVGALRRTAWVGATRTARLSVSAANPQIPTATSREPPRGMFGP